MSHITGKSLIEFHLCWFAWCLCALAWHEHRLYLSTEEKFDTFLTLPIGSFVKCGLAVPYQSPPAKELQYLHSYYTFFEVIRLN